MRSGRLSSLCVAALGVIIGAMATARAADLGPVAAPPPPPPVYSWYIHAGPAVLSLSEGASMAAGGVTIPGATISIPAQPTVAAEIGYFFTPNIAVSFTGGFPPRARINGAGVLAGMGNLGGATYGPMTLTAHYHFVELGRLQPYVGLGPTFMYVFNTKDGLVTNLKVDHAIGFAVQAGADFMITDQWGVFFDVKKAYLRTIATGALGPAPIRARVRLDPLVLHTGVTFRF